MPSLIIFSFDLEICLWMRAYRTKLRSLLADYNVSAVCALPNHIAIAGENKSVVEVFKQLTIPFLMLFFNLADHFK